MTMSWSATRRLRYMCWHKCTTNVSNQTLGGKGDLVETNLSAKCQSKLRGIYILLSCNTPSIFPRSVSRELNISLKIYKQTCCLAIVSIFYLFLLLPHLNKTKAKLNLKCYASFCKQNCNIWKLNKYPQFHHIWKKSNNLQGT